MIHDPNIIQMHSAEPPLVHNNHLVQLHTMQKFPQIVIGSARMPLTRVSTVLSNIENVYKEQAPVMLANKLANATELQINDFESLLGTTLPPEYRQFLLLNTIEHTFPGNYNCLSLQEVVSDWQLMAELLDTGVFNDGRTGCIDNRGGFLQPDTWWSKKWIPFARDSCGNLCCIDLAPGPNGSVGQIINMEIQDQQGPFCTGTGSFAEYLFYFSQCLSHGSFTVYDHGIEIDD